MLRQDDWQKAILVNFGYANGKEWGGHLASCAIMSCMMNRVRLGWGSVSEVIASAPKYAAEESLPVIMPSIWDQNFIRILTEVEGIYDGSAKDLSCGGIYFCDLRRIERPWFLDEIIRSGNYAPVANMNSLTFYAPGQNLSAKEHAAKYGRERTEYAFSL